MKTEYEIKEEKIINLENQIKELQNEYDNETSNKRKMMIENEIIDLEEEIKMVENN